MKSPFWTDERIQTMRDLLDKGWSASKIAAELGCTRNAVIGKTNRLEASNGVALTRNHGIKTGPRIAVLKSGTAAARRLPRSSNDGLDLLIQPQKPAYVPGTPVGILDVIGCKYPVSEDSTVIGPHLFCNAPRAPGDARYCPHHLELCTFRSSTATVKQRTLSAFGLRFPKGRVG